MKFYVLYILRFTLTHFTKSKTFERVSKVSEIKFSRQGFAFSLKNVHSCIRWHSIELNDKIYPHIICNIFETNVRILEIS